MEKYLKAFSFSMMVAYAAFVSDPKAFAKNDSTLEISNRSNLAFGDEVSGVLKKDFGPGWASLTLNRTDASPVRILTDEQLSPGGGVVFSMAGNNAVSPSGRYVILDVIRNEIGDTENGGVAVQSRQYCPILDAATGCLVHDEGGDSCGGSWDSKADIWVTQTDAGKQEKIPVISMSKPSAVAIWKTFDPALGGELTRLAKEAGGMENIKACDPPSEKNSDVYSKIISQLKKESSSLSTPRNGIIKSSREYIYDLPAVSDGKHSYFIKEDKVTVLDFYGDDWLFVRYVRKGKSSIEGWIQAKNVEIKS